jgi:P27 family predicted phage terminase small subunit
MPAGRPVGENLLKKKLHSLKTQQTTGTRRRLQEQEGAQTHLSPLTADMLEVPAHLRGKPDFEKSFRQARDILLALDIATIGDLFSASLLCSAWAELEYLNFLIDQEGYMIEEMTAKGDVVRKINPLLAERMKVNGSLRQLLTQFGLTPSTRRHVFQRDPAKPKSQDDEEWDDLLN